jgi:hypothetical protein
MAIAVIRDITLRCEAEESLREAERFSRSTIDALSAHLCVLDGKGTILATNQAWRSFAAANPPEARRTDIGANYLEVCDSVTGVDAREAAEFAAGIREVIRGERFAFALEYSCHSPMEKRWFIGRVTGFLGPGPVRVVVAHENITERKKAEIERENLIGELQEAMASVKMLSGLVPICAGCKKIRDDTGYWNQLETYIQRHTEARFSHGLCPECIKQYYPGVNVQTK